VLDEDVDQMGCRSYLLRAFVKVLLQGFTHMISKTTFLEQQP